MLSTCHFPRAPNSIERRAAVSPYSIFWRHDWKSGHPERYEPLKVIREDHSCLRGSQRARLSSPPLEGLIRGAQHQYLVEAKSKARTQSHGGLPIAKEPSHYPSLHCFVSSLSNVLKDTQIYVCCPCFHIEKDWAGRSGEGTKLALEHVKC